jgi:mannose-6-phosphate isomerase-like protein (cupin superfamily)
MINELGKTYTRPWGNYQTLSLADTHQVKIIAVNPGGRLSLQKHSKRAEHWVVVEGQPTITINDNTQSYHVGDCVFIPIGALHRLENHTHTTTKIVEVQIGTYLGEDDIIRIEDCYGR